MSSTNVFYKHPTLNSSNIFRKGSKISTVDVQHQCLLLLKGLTQTYSTNVPCCCHPQDNRPPSVSSTNAQCSNETKLAALFCGNGYLKVKLNHSEPEMLSTGWFWFICLVSAQNSFPDIFFLKSHPHRRTGGDRRYRILQNFGRCPSANVIFNKNTVVSFYNPNPTEVLKNCWFNRDGWYFQLSIL